MNTCCLKKSAYFAIDAFMSAYHVDRLANALTLLPDNITFM